MRSIYIGFVHTASHAAVCVPTAIYTQDLIDVGVSEIANDWPSRFCPLWKAVHGKSYDHGTASSKPRQRERELSCYYEWKMWSINQLGKRASVALLRCCNVYRPPFQKPKFLHY